MSNPSPLPFTTKDGAGGGEEETEDELAEEAEALSAASRSCSRDIAGNMARLLERTYQHRANREQKWGTRTRNNKHMQSGSSVVKSL